MRHLLDRAKRLASRTVFFASAPPLRRWWRGRTERPDEVPPPGLVRFGSLRRVEPLSREWGLDRGGPIDRYYIESFMAANRQDIHGRVLEIAEDVYTKWFGGDAVTQPDILQYAEGEHPRATFTGDLTSADHIPSNTFDCLIVTQTLQLIYELRPAIATMHRILKPGGVLLLTVPGISQVNRHDSETWGEYWCWSFTGLSMRRLFGERFGPENVEVQTHGNVLAAAGFLFGMGQDDLSRRELDFHDPDYELLITVRARKEGGPA